MSDLGRQAPMSWGEQFRKEHPWLHRKARLRQRVLDARWSLAMAVLPRWVRDDLRDPQGESEHEAVELALEGERWPKFRRRPEDGYLCDRPTPDMSGPEYEPVADEEAIE